MNSNKIIFKTRPYLAAAVIAHCVQAALLFTGLQYHTKAAQKLILEGFPMLIWVDRAAAALLLISAFLQLLAMIKTAKHPRTAEGSAIAAYILLILCTIAGAAARFMITQLSPLTLSVVLQVPLYTILLAVQIKTKNSNTKPEANYEERQCPVYSNSVLQGGGSPSGNITGTEDKNDGTDPETADLAKEQDHVCE